jgi:hypothetical protein
MSIKYACKLRALVTTKLSKEGCITLIVRGRLHELCKSMIEKGVGPFQLEKNTFPK